MPLHEIRAVAFDLDGTLVDSAPDIAHALNQALASAGLAAFDVPQVRGWVGDGPDALIERALGARGRAATPEQRSTLRRGFDAATLAAPLAHGHVYDGIAVLLAQLAQQLPLVVVSNKPSALSRSVLRSAGLLPHLTAVHGADESGWRKPAPVLLQRAALALGLSSAQLLMVGDSAADLLCAAAAGAPAVLVGWGYGGDAARALEPRWQIDHPAQLPGLVLPG